MGSTNVFIIFNIFGHLFEICCKSCQNVMFAFLLASVVLCLAFFCVVLRSHLIHRHLIFGCNHSQIPSEFDPFQKSWHFTHSLKGGRSFILATTLGEGLLYIFPGLVAPSIGSIAHCPSPNWQVSMNQDQSPWMQVREVLLHCPLPKHSPQE